MTISPETRVALTAQIVAGLLAGQKGEYLTHNGDYWALRSEGTDRREAATPSVVLDAREILRAIEVETIIDICEQERRATPIDSSV